VIFHHETDDVAVPTASEAMGEALVFNDGKAGRIFGVEGTAGGVLAAGAAQFDHAADDGRDGDALLDGIDALVNRASDPARRRRRTRARDAMNSSTGISRFTSAGIHGANSRNCSKNIPKAGNKVNIYRNISSREGVKTPNGLRTKSIAA
jgi:hypothetical protein